MSNMVSVLLEAGSAYLSRALGSPPYNLGHYDPLLCSLLISDCNEMTTRYFVSQPVWDDD
jgi:hypothetical protein